MLSGFTVSLKAGEVLTAKFASPLYSAKIVWLPTARLVSAGLMTAVPFTSDAVPRMSLLTIGPLKNVTLPVGEPMPGASAVTVADNVTG